MNERRDLRLYVVPPGCGASFALRREDGLILLQPRTPEASSWLADAIGNEATWYEGKLQIEQRYLPGIVDAIIDAGFLFEGDPGIDATH